MFGAEVVATERVNIEGVFPTLMGIAIFQNSVRMVHLQKLKSNYLQKKKNERRRRRNAVGGGGIYII